MFHSPKTINRKRRYDAENGALLFARLASKHSVDLSQHPIINESLDPGFLIEIDGPVGSGKTALLTDVAADCIMSTAAGGLGTNVAYIDCDRQFHINRLISCIDRKYSSCHSKDYHSIGVIDECELTEYLERFHYVACDGSDDFLHALELFDDILGPAGTSLNPTSGWIMLIDGINAFYWLDRTTRMRTEVAQIQQMYAHRVRRFLNEHNVAAIVTKLAIDVPSCGENGQAPPCENGEGKKTAVSCTMETTWRKLVTKSLRLSSTRIAGRIIHKANSKRPDPVAFEVCFNGITYL